MKKIFLISILFILSISLFAEDCGKKLDCPGGIKYPYRFCNIELKQNEVYCADNPYDFADSRADLLLYKIKIPICESFYGVPSDAQVRLRRYEGIDLFNGSSAFLEDIKVALDKWNCACVSIPVEADDCEYGIRFEFLDDPREYREKTGADPKFVPATGVIPGTQAGKGDVCEPNTDVTVYFNATPIFLYDVDKFPEGSIEYDPKLNPAVPFKKGWVNQKYAKNVELIPDSVSLVSLMHVALHEIGHILGFDHYNKGETGGFACEGDAEGVMKSSVGDIRVTGNNITELSNHDKCMFANLYCSDLVVGIEEEENVVRPDIIISPNPASKELNISFEILGGTKSVTIQLLNEQGQLLETLLTSAIYNSGIHIYSASLDLPSGIYFVLTKINHTIYSEKIIIK